MLLLNDLKHTKNITFQSKKKTEVLLYNSTSTKGG